MRARTLFGVLCAAGFYFNLTAGYAQDFSNVITFGDSLSDNGNLFALTTSLVGIVPDVEPAPPSPPYFNGRFSNGPVWVELLAERLTGRDMTTLYKSAIPFELNPAVGNVNAAIGGARTDDAPSGSSPVSFGIPEQLTDFKGAGGTIGANDLVTLWGGANNLFQDLPTATSQQQAIQIAQGAAIAELADLNRLIGPEFGARNILLPNLPPIPGIAIASNPSIPFNLTLDAGTRAAAAANPGVNIVQMDVFNAFIIIVSNPSAFGFTDVTTPCLVGATECANPNQHLFWDEVHPTAAAHDYLAQYALLLLSTAENALAVAPLADSAFNLRLEASQAAFNHTLDAMSFPGEWHPGLYAEVIGSKLDLDGSGGAPSYHEELGGVRGGVNGHLGSGIAGVSLAYLRGNHSQPGLSADVESFQGDVYGAMQVQRLFVSAEAGLSYTNFDNISRFTGFPTVDAESDTHGWSYSASIGTGTVIDMGGFKLIPNGRLGYLNSDLNAFSESAPILALEYADRSIASGFWSLALRAATEFGTPHHPITAYAEAGYESLFATDTDPITAHLVGNTALPVSVAVDDPASRGLYFKLGAAGHLDDATTLSLDYGLSLNEGDGESHTGRVQLKFLLGGEEPLK
jgi:outer membrane lipase/esterase